MLPLMFYLHRVRSLVPERIPLQRVLPHVLIECRPIHAHMLPTRPISRVVACKGVGGFQRDIRSTQRRHADEVQAVCQVWDLVAVRHCVLIERLTYRTHAMQLVRNRHDEEAARGAVMDVPIADGRGEEPFVVGFRRPE